MKALGANIIIASYIICFVTGLWGFFLCMGIISKVAGFWGIVLSLLLYPITFVAAPLYEGFACDNWFPLLVNYGGGIGALVLCGIGRAIGGELD